MTKTLFDKIWDAHVVSQVYGDTQVLYIDQHLIHEVTSPQAFTGLEKRGLPLFRPNQTLATADHNVPTIDQHLPIKEELSRLQVKKLEENCEKFGVQLFGLGHPKQGIVHVIGPELGITRPGMTLVCGDSHTSTHGAFGSIAFGIGTSQVEQVMATQCLLLKKPKTMRIHIDGKVKEGVTAKDIVLYIISKLSAGGATGYFIEYTGQAITDLSMEGRMTICNMSIEMGARGGLIAPDEVTFDYMRGREYAPKADQFEKAILHWKTLYSDKEATFDQFIEFKAEDIGPMVTFGTNPGMGIMINQKVPDTAEGENPETYNKALHYMGLNVGQSMIDLPISHVFIGSCTNSRIEDLRLAAQVVEGQQKAPHIQAWIVPGSKQVERQAKEEGLDKIFLQAGFEFREPGCSACLGMNEDKIPSGAYCVSTSNRNFEGRQGPGSRTILASPLTAAAAAIHGKIIDIQPLIKRSTHAKI